MRFRAVSPLLATVILIAITVSAGAAVYLASIRWMVTLSPSLSIQVISSSLILVGDRVMLSISVKNSGSKPLAGIIITGYDDGGKCFKLALPPADPGQTSSNTLIIPLGASNIVLDGSGNNNHGTIYGAATWTDGIYGKAISFSGTNNYIRISRSETLKFTDLLAVAVWVKASVLDDVWRRFVCSGTNALREWSFYRVRPGVSGSANRISFELFDASGNPYTLSTPFPMEVDRWYFVIGMVNRGEITLHVDGNLVSRRYITGFTLRQTPYPIGIGGWGDGTGDYWLGAIDEVRIYSRSLSQEETAFSTTNPSLPITNGLVLWLPLDEGSSAPFRFTIGEKYPLTVTFYSFDGMVASQTIIVSCSK